MASKSTLVSKFMAFIHVFADLKNMPCLVLDNFGRQSSTCIDPGANPSLQEHSKLPRMLVQVPLPQMFGLLRHSLSSMHFMPEESSTYPMGHSQRKEPSVLTQSPPSQTFGIISHSSKSLPVSPRPAPSGQSLANSSTNKHGSKITAKKRRYYLILL